MITPSESACALNISLETLSALRDEALAPNEAQHLRQHITGCVACQARIVSFNRVARALHLHRDLEPGRHVWDELRPQLARRRATVNLVRRNLLGGAAAALSVALSAVLFAMVLRNHHDTIQPGTSGTVTATIGTSTPTPTGPCQPFNPSGNPALLANVPLPPGTLIGLGNGATGEVVTLACTPNGTKDSITAYLNGHLPGAGWHRFDAKKDVNDGCAYVTWVKDHEALAWDFTIFQQLPPKWTILTCGRINLAS